MGGREPAPAPEAGASVPVFVDLPLPLFERLRLAAVAERRTLAQLMRTALDDYLPGGDQP